MRTIGRRAVIGVVVATLALTPAPAEAGERAAASTAAGSEPAALQWSWPLRGFRIAAAYAAPANEYAAGHRGVDLEPHGADRVLSPAAGIVAFSGSVAGRGILTIDHGGGLVSTLEPIASELHPGDAVRRGDEVGRIAFGGHADPGTIHFGVRLEGRYINPMLLLGGVPRAVLLPCCD